MLTLIGCYWQQSSDHDACFAMLCEKARKVLAETPLDVPVKLPPLSEDPDE